MGSKVLLICDLHTDEEVEGTSRVSFTYDDIVYRLDVCAGHNEEVRSMFADLIKRVPADQQGEPGYPTAPRTRRRTGGITRTSSYDAGAVRKWAVANKIKVAPQGRIAEKVLVQFREANDNR